MTPEQEAAEGIRQVEQGDFETAVITLDSAIKRLDGQPGRQRSSRTRCCSSASRWSRSSRGTRQGAVPRALELDPKLPPPR
jgi:hypothetical protein